MSLFNEVEEAIGFNFGTDTVIKRNGTNESGRTLIQLQCNKCGAYRDVLWKRFNYDPYCCKKCNCMGVSRESYDKLIGTEYQGYIVEGTFKSNNRTYLNVKCLKCGDKKEVVAGNFRKKDVRQ